MHEFLNIALLSLCHNYVNDVFFLKLNVPFFFLSRAFCNYGMCATYLGAGCVYIVFIATTLRDVFNFLFDLNWDVRLYIAIVIVPMLFLGQIRQLKYLVPFSALANLFIVITFSITLYYLFHGKMEFSERPLFSSMRQLPQFFR